MKNLILPFLILCAQLAGAQDSLCVQLNRITWRTLDGEIGGCDPSFNVQYMSGSTLLIPKICHEFNGAGSNGFRDLTELDSFSISNPNSTFHFRLEGWEDDNCGPNCSGDDCPWDSDDDRQFFDTVYLYKAFVPQKWYAQFVTTTDQEEFDLNFKIKRYFPTIQAPKFADNNPRPLCPSESPKFLIDYDAVKTGIRYQWEYSFLADSTPTGRKWKAFPITMDTFKIINIDTLFSETDTLQYQTKFYLRVRCIGEQGFRYSAASAFTILPKAPVAAPISYASCPQSATGIIDITNIQGIDNQYRYILRTGLNNNAPCNPDLNTCFLNQAASGFTNAGINFYTLDSLYKGGYTLWVINSGGFKGSCYNTYNVVVDSLPRLTFQLRNVQHVTCHGGRDGTVRLIRNHTKGAYTLDQLPPGVTMQEQDTVILLRNMAAGTYSLRLKDFCGVYTAPVQFTVNQPDSLTATSISLPIVSCNNPGDGWINTEILGGSGSYNYNLYRQNTLVTALTNQPSSQGFTGLSAGRYFLEVKDAARPSCPALVDTFDILPQPALNLTKTVGDIVCNGANTGFVQLTGSGGAGRYRYALYDYTRQVTLQDTSGLFPNLYAGTYRGVIRNRDAACLDSLVLDRITIQQRPPLAVAMSSKNVTCSGADNGYVAARVSGGTAPYRYSWYFQNGTQTFPFTAGNGLDSITNLSPTAYQLAVTDANNCTISSAFVSVREPNALALDSVKTNHVVCFASAGSLSVYASGGTTPYNIQVTQDNWVTQQSIRNSGSPLYAGSYNLRMTDAQNCRVDFPSTLTIESPSAPLTVVHTTSDFNGVQVSCRGRNDGTVTLVASDGNGGSFSGYSYSNNRNTFGSNAVFSGLAAGRYTFYVKDGRGCIDSTTANLTQPQTLALTITAQKNLRCGNDSDGSVRLKAVGGTPNYLFSFNGGLFKTDTLIQNLSRGTVQLALKDVNGCTAAISTNITSQHLPLNSNITTDSVSCFGLSDGKANPQILGGVSPYQYNWQTSSAQFNTAIITGLKAGFYPLTLTDAVNCTFETTAKVGEPKEPLSFQNQVLPICLGATNGGFTLLPKGGTRPYQFALNTGTPKRDSIFTGLSEGLYTLTVKDYRNCSLADTFRISKQVIDLRHQFLVANNQYLGDTLVVVNTTNPLPDSFRWQFDPRITLVNALGRTARIAFTSVDSFNVTLHSFFSGCQYSTSKWVQVLLRDTAYYSNSNTVGILTASVLPNPNSGTFVYNFTLSKVYPVVNIDLISPLGQVLYQSTKTFIRQASEPVTLNNPSPGIYLLRIRCENKMKTLTVLIE